MGGKGRKPKVLKEVTDLRKRVNAGKPINVPSDIKALLYGDTAPSNLPAVDIIKLNEYVTTKVAKTQSTVDKSVAKPVENKPKNTKRKFDDGKKQSTLDNFLGKNDDTESLVSSRTRSKKSKPDSPPLARLALDATTFAQSDSHTPLGTPLARLAPILQPVSFARFGLPAQSDSPIQFDTLVWRAPVDSPVSFNFPAPVDSPVSFNFPSHFDLPAQSDSPVPSDTLARSTQSDLPNPFDSPAQSDTLARPASDDPFTCPGNKYPICTFIDYYEKTGDDQFVCLKCRRTCKTLHGVKQHYTWFHSAFDRGMPSQFFSITDDLKFKCKQCDDVNGTLTDARNHFHVCKNVVGTTEERKRQWKSDRDWSDRMYMNATPARKEHRRIIHQAYHKTENWKKKRALRRKSLAGKREIARENSSPAGRLRRLRQRNKKRKILSEGRAKCGKTHRVIAAMNQSRDFYDRMHTEAKMIEASGRKLSGVFVSNQMADELKNAIDSNLHGCFKDELFATLADIYPNDSCKANYAYILCDSCMWHSGMTFGDFISSIFYVGRGVDLRFVSHFFHALFAEKYKDQLNNSCRAKEDTINGAWKKGNSIKVLRFYIGDKAELADFLEFAMVFTIGMDNLTNNKLDGPMTTPAHFTISDVCSIGVHVLGGFFERRDKAVVVTKDDLINKYARLKSYVKSAWSTKNLRR